MKENSQRRPEMKIFYQKLSLGVKTARFAEAGLLEGSMEPFFQYSSLSAFQVLNNRVLFLRRKDRLFVDISIGLPIFNTRSPMVAY